MRVDGESRWVSALLVITFAMGMLDAISLLHFGTFTGYMTGTVILIGVGLAKASNITGASIVALCAFVAGAFAGGRLVRRPHPSLRLVSDVLLGVAALVGVAAVLGTAAYVLPVVAVLGLAMGLQTSATRHAGVADMAMPAATLILHGLAHDSRLAGGDADRVGRRIGALAALIGGAAAGAWLSRRHVSIGLVAVSLVILLAAVLLRYDPSRSIPSPAHAGEGVGGRD